MAEVTLTKLNKYFDTTHVVKDVDLQIRDKEFMVVDDDGKVAVFRARVNLSFKYEK